LNHFRDRHHVYFFAATSIPALVEGRIDFNKYEGLQPVYSEYNIGPYRRSFRISGMIDQDKITAELRDGVITLVLPKAERAKPRRIEIG
jgi:HSP20 family protein